MSFDGSIELTWGGDVRKFRLGIDELLALQEKRNSGPLEIVARLQLGAWRIEDITETLRIGLVGAGTGTPAEATGARDLVERNVRPGRITSNVLTALAILLTALQGDERDDVGKKKAARRKKVKPASVPQASTETAQ
jgi:hypothetical protein